MVRISSIVLLAVACGGAAPLVPTDVHGVVLGVDSRPLAGALVSIAGQPAVTAAADGSFSFAKVLPPYDVLVGFSQGAHSFGTAWIGLRGASPVLTVAVPQGTFEGIACGTVSGAQSGVETLNHASHILLQAPGLLPRVNFVEPPTNQYCAEAEWIGDPPAQVVANVLEIDYAVSDQSVQLATGFGNYGKSAPFALADAQVVQGVSVALSPITAGKLHVDTATPPDATAFQLSAGVFFGTGTPNLAIPLAQLSSGIKSADIAVPLLPDATVFAQLFAITPAGIALTMKTFQGSGSWSASVPVNASITSPLANATVVAGTKFSWTAAGTGGVNQLALTNTTSNQLVSLRVVTADALATLPDFTIVGVQLPASQPGTWQVSGLGPVSSIDDFTSEAQLGLANQTSYGLSQLSFSQSTARPLSFGP